MAVPTLVNKVIDPDSGSGTDYTSLSAWDAGEASDISETTGANESHVAECRCTGGTADTTNVVLSASWVTEDTVDGPCAIQIWTTPTGGYRHNGTYQTGNKYRMEPTSGSAPIYLANTGGADHLSIIGLQLKCRNASYQYGLWLEGTAMTGGWYIVEQCVINGTAIAGGSTNGYGMRLRRYSKTGYISNNIIYGFHNGSKAGFHGIYFDGVGTCYCYNNTVVDCKAYGYYNANASYPPILKNCIAMDCDDGFGLVSGSWGTGTDYNASDIASDAPGSNSQNGTDVTFVNKASWDLHLSSSDTVAKGNGVNLYSDSNYPVTKDIDNSNRLSVSPNYDMGADEITFWNVVSMNTADATAQGVQISATIGSGATTVDLDEAELTASGIALSVVLGGITPSLSEATLTAAGQTLSVVKGAITRGLDEATITATAQAATAVPGSLTTGLSTAVGTLAGQALSVVLGGVTKVLDVADAVFTGQALSVVLGGISKVLDTAVATATGQALSTVLGGITKVLDTGLVTAVAQDIFGDPGNILFDTATITAVPQALTVVLGAISATLGTAAITAGAQAATAVVGDLTVLLENAWLAIRAQYLDVLNPGITFDTATLTATGQAITAAFGGIIAYAPTAELRAIAQEIDTKEKILRTATVTATAIAISCNIVACDTATLTAVPQDISVVKSGSEYPAGFGFGTPAKIPTDMELQGDGVWVEQGSPSVLDEGHGFFTLCYPVTGQDRESSPVFSQYPDLWPENPPRWEYVDEDPPDDDTTYLYGQPPQVRPSIELLIGDVGTFPDLPTNSIILKVGVPIRVNGTLGVAYGVNLCFGAGESFPQGPTLFIEQESTWYTAQADFDRDPRDKSFWTPEKIREIYSVIVVGDPSGSFGRATSGNFLFSSTKLCVHFLKANELKKYPQGLLMLDSLDGSWHHWKSKDNL